jgi:hypothetical protein
MDPGRDMHVVSRVVLRLRSHHTPVSHVTVSPSYVPWFPHNLRRHGRLITEL